jgi:hypothetical protein
MPQYGVIESEESINYGQQPSDIKIVIIQVDPPLELGAVSQRSGQLFINYWHIPR